MFISGESIEEKSFVLKRPSKNKLFLKKNHITSNASPKKDVIATFEKEITPF